MSATSEILDRDLLPIARSGALGDPLLMDDSIEFSLHSLRSDITRDSIHVVALSIYHPQDGLLTIVRTTFSKFTLIERSYTCCLKLMFTLKMTNLQSRK